MITSKSLSCLMREVFSQSRNIAALLPSTALALCLTTLALPPAFAEAAKSTPPTHLVVQSPQQQAGLRLVKARLAESFTESADGASEVSVETLFSSLNREGHWPDLDIKYPGESNLLASRYVHFLRVWKLAAAWRLSKDEARRAELNEAIQRALNYWLYKPHPLGIPWFYLIGAPQGLARAALIMDEQLSPAQRQAVVAILRTCVREDGVLMYAGGPATGQNLQHEAELQIVAGALSGDAAMIAHHAALIEREIAIRDAEGLKADWSFHQHGPQLYSGGLYGNGFSRDATKLAWALNGTPFAFKPATVDAIIHYVADGQQWMMRGRSFDYLTAGRMVAWPDYKGVEPEGELGVADAAKHLAAIAGLAPRRRDELLALSARKAGEAPAESAPPGNRLFWASDYMSHQRPGFFASARMSSRRTHGTESGNGQNVQGYHLGDGAMGLMVTGEEYRDIFPLWDWRRVPGVTAVYNPTIPFPRHTWGKGSRGWSDFAGGVSDQVAGVAAMEVGRAGLHAYKAWFFLDDMVVCLGAGILPDDPALPVVTSIEQRWGNGAVRASSVATTVTPETTFAQNQPGWIHHAGVTFLFPSGGEVRVRYEHKTAPWSVINTATHGSMFRTSPLSEVIADGNVFSLWIEHGAGLYAPTQYSYIVAPGLAPEKANTFLKNTAPKILANTEELQAITRDDITQVVFWKAGQVSLPDGRTLSADRPSIVQLRRGADGKWLLAAGNPTHQPGVLQVGLRGSGASAKWQKLRFDFPAGLYVGQAQVRTLR
jgi:chondroitin AC lyase